MKSAFLHILYNEIEVCSFSQEKKMIVLHVLSLPLFSSPYSSFGWETLSSNEMHLIIYQILYEDINP